MVVAWGRGRRFEDLEEAVSVIVGGEFVGGVGGCEIGGEDGVAVGLGAVDGDGVAGGQVDVSRVSEGAVAVAEEIDEGKGDAEGGEVGGDGDVTVADVVVDDGFDDEGVGGWGDVEAGVGVCEDGVCEAGGEEGLGVAEGHEEHGCGGVDGAGDVVRVCGRDGVGEAGRAIGLRTKEVGRAQVEGEGEEDCKDRLETHLVLVLRMNFRMGTQLLIGTGLGNVVKKNPGFPELGRPAKEYGCYSIVCLYQVFLWGNWGTCRLHEMSESADRL